MTDIHEDFEKTRQKKLSSILMDIEACIFIGDKIKKFYEYLSLLTKEEADLIETACMWDEELKTPFLLAKSFYDELPEND